MSKHRATRPRTNWRAWGRYFIYRLALAVINTRTKALRKALQENKPQTK